VLKNWETAEADALAIEIVKKPKASRLAIAKWSSDDVSRQDEEVQCCGIEL
jgi:hypothetical protein